MVLELGPIKLANPAGLWALLALVPLIIMYLIRPRPKPIKIPSLMFFMKSKGARKFSSFLKQLTKDWLFLVQLLIILALALTFADPYTMYSHDITSENTVIVLDVSASSQALENGRMRFDIAVSKAKDSLGGKNTLILAKDTPFIALQDASSSEMRKYLNSLRPKTTTSQIGEAIILAGELLKGDGRVVVISDFINTGGQDPHIAKSVLETKGKVVEFINTATGERPNIGIIEMDVGSDETTMYIKNYDVKPYNVPLTIGGSGTTLTIPAKGIETYSFKTPGGVTKIEIGIDDNLIADNIAYISAPEGGKARVLVVTNNRSNFLENALLASGEVNLEVAIPPVMPQEDYDVYILHELDMNKVLPGTLEDIRRRTQERGGSAVVHVQYNSNNIDYKGISPVVLNAPKDGGIVQIDQMNAFTKNAEFGTADQYFESELKSGAVRIASINDQPLIAMKQDGLAKYVYYGIPETSEFKYSTSYPIFWTELLKHLTAAQDVRNLNYKAGDTIILGEKQIIETPSRKVKKASIILDETGIYHFEDRTVAVNLLNEKESDISAKEIEGTKSVDYELQAVKEQREYPWTITLIILGIIALYIELLIIKRRGYM
jgi:hypothetical protein